MNMFKKQSVGHQNIDKPVIAKIGIEIENPYLTARRTWNEHVGSVVSSRQTWQVVGILSLLIALASVGGVIHIGSQSKYIPYVIEVDKLGQTIAVGPVQAAGRADQRVVHASVSEFVSDARYVTPDVACSAKPSSGCMHICLQMIRPRPR